MSQIDKIKYHYINQCSKCPNIKDHCYPCQLDYYAWMEQQLISMALVLDLCGGSDSWNDMCIDIALLIE